jgi:small-conductance mechanosensitive channel
VALFTWVVWEVGTALLDGQVEHLVAQAQLTRAARWRTLLPILRTLLLVVMLIFLVMTVLSEIGVNTAPLLAGASIFGVALGFGSQKLVQDFITGLFLLFENAMQVGDFVTVSGLSGSVEHLSIRTIRLRDGDGSVHIIPFSSVTSVTNVNRGMGNAAVGVIVAAHEDTDRVCVVLKEIGAELREDTEYGPMILGDLALWGIDKVDGSGITIAGQIACTDSGRWGVQREFNRRMKRRLQDEGIELAVPVQTVVVKHEREAPARASTPPGAAPERAAPTALSPPPAQDHAA